MIKDLKNDEAVSPVIGVILMVAITVVLSVVVFLMVGKVGNTDTDILQLTMHEEDDQSYMVYSISDTEVEWNELTVTGCNILPLDSDLVSVGDLIDDCGDDVIISYKNHVIWRND